MKILVLNGSPRSGASNTMQLTAAFLEGLQLKHEIINITGTRIEPCKGCFYCWKTRPGKCCIADDMENLLQKYIEAELVVWSFPLYYYGMPSKIKTFMDRLLPLNLPYIAEKENGKAGHPSRYDLSEQRHVLISTCGFYSTENNYEALVKQFDIVFGNQYTKVLCPQGELFSIPQLKGKTDEYLDLVRQAGAEYLSLGRFSAEIESWLTVPFFPKEAFIEMANASWEIPVDDAAPQKKAEQPSRGERMLRQMSAVYSPVGNSQMKHTAQPKNAAQLKQAAPKGEKHIEFFFTDTDETYQLRVNETGAVFVKDPALFAPYSLRIETPLEVWQEISLGRISGTEALYQHKYRVLGDFLLMTSIMEGFAPRKNAASAYFKNTAQKERQPKKRSMLVFLLPFLALWVLVPLFGNAGIFAVILTSAGVPLFTWLYRLSPYDKAGAFIAGVLCVLYLAGISLAVVITLSYLLFGSLWIVSLFCRIPLCAWYSANDFNGDEAFDNPLFIRTNRIIAGMWGILYLCMTAYSWFILQTDLASLIGLINSILPTFAGIVTFVFVKWYPAYFARKICR